MKTTAKTATKLPIVVIDRSIWRRGQGRSGSKLIKDGEYCAWGFALKALGVTDEQMGKKVMPYQVVSDSVLPHLQDICASITAGQIAQTNDSRCLTEQRRELLITQDFKALGFKVKFLGQRDAA
jgi:hypothetical protein